MFCKNCGAEIDNKSKFCIECGGRIDDLGNIPSNNYSNIAQGDRSLNLDFTSLSPYYQEEFKRIYESHEAYKGKWNWCAFLFSGIWSLTKGVWLPIVIAVGATLITWGIYGVIYCIICGIRGNYMYYNSYVKGKQIPA